MTEFEKIKVSEGIHMIYSRYLKIAFLMIVVSLICLSIAFQKLSYAVGPIVDKATSVYMWYYCGMCIAAVSIFLGLFTIFRYENLKRQLKLHGENMSFNQMLEFLGLR
jgi:hypothetical protein